MKILLACLALACAQAHASETVSISCTSARNELAGISLTAKTLAIGEDNDASMTDVVMAFSGEGRDSTETGRARTLDADERYQPRKYKDHVRFDMSKLVDVKAFDRYLPGDTCSISVMIPTNAVSQKTFNAPTVVNCDQSGGTLTLNCQAKMK